MRGALIGFGKIASATHVAALQQHGIDIVAVLETDAARAVAAHQQLPEARLYTQLEALFMHETLTCVAICTPPYLHMEAAVAALRRGIHVLCEKPLVLQWSDALLLRQLAAQHNAVVGCVHNWTAAPVVRHAQAMLQAGVLGDLHSVDIVTLRQAAAGSALGTPTGAANWRLEAAKAGGGILFDHGWHGMSILLRTIATTPRDVWGVCQKATPNAVEHTAESWISFDNGVIAHYLATWQATQRCNTALWKGSHGHLSLQNDTLQFFNAQGGLCSSEKFTESLAEGGYRPNWTACLVEEFVREIRGQQRGALLQEALLCLRLLLATYASAASRPPQPRWVRVDSAV